VRSSDVTEVPHLGTGKNSKGIEEAAPIGWGGPSESKSVAEVPKSELARTEALERRKHHPLEGRSCHYPASPVQGIPPSPQSSAASSSVPTQSKLLFALLTRRLAFPLLLLKAKKRKIDRSNFSFSISICASSSFSSAATKVTLLPFSSLAPVIYAQALLHQPPLALYFHTIFKFLLTARLLIWLLSLSIARARITAPTRSLPCSHLSSFFRYAFLSAAR